MQFQADILNAEVVRPACMETTALGAAYLAGLACGFFKNIAELRGLADEKKVFFPNMEEALRAKKLYEWEEALGRDMYRSKV